MFQIKFRVSYSYVSAQGMVIWSCLSYIHLNTRWQYSMLSSEPFGEAMGWKASEIHGAIKSLNVQINHRRWRFRMHGGKMQLLPSKETWQPQGKQNRGTITTLKGTHIHRFTTWPTEWFDNGEQVAVASKACCWRSATDVTSEGNRKVESILETEQKENETWPKQNKSSFHLKYSQTSECFLFDAIL